MTNFRLIAVLPFFSVLFALSCAQSKPNLPKFKCNGKDKLYIDGVVGRIMTYGLEDRSFPQNKTQLKEYCSEQRHLIYQLESYKSQCLKSRPKQAVSIIVYSIKSLVNSVCKKVNSRKTKALLNSAVCANAATMGYLECSSQYVSRLLAIEANRDSKKQLGTMCCGYAEVFKCIREQAAQHEECTEERIGQNEDYIRGFFENSVNLLCGDYNADTDRCDRFEFTQAKEGAIKNMPVSFFSPMVNALVNL